MQNASNVLSVYKNSVSQMPCRLCTELLWMPVAELINRKDSPVHKQTRGNDYFSLTTEEMNLDLDSSIWARGKN